MEVPAKHFGFMYFSFLFINTFYIICDSSKNECENVMLFETGKARCLGLLYCIYRIYYVFFLFLQAWCDIYFPRYLFSPTLTTIAKDKFESEFLLEANYYF